MTTMNWAVGRRVCVMSGTLCLVLAVSRCLGGLPPDPGNAALLYYQAMVQCPDCESDVMRELENVSFGSEPDRRVDEYVGRCRNAITYAEKASQISHCDWGLLYSLGLSQSLPLERMRLLSDVLYADARILAARGDYRAAIARCMTMQGFASHIGNETNLLYRRAMGIQDKAERGICQILGSIPPDAEFVGWVIDQCASVPVLSPSPAKVLEMDWEMALQSMRVSDVIMGMIRTELVLVQAVDRGIVENPQSLSDEELLECIRKPYEQFLDSVISALDDDVPYEDVCAEIEQIMVRFKESMRSAPLGGTVSVNAITMAAQVPRLYDVQVRRTAGRNAFSVALAVYHEKATTGQLPRELPPGLPKDPYTCKDFLYAVKEDGFVLCSPVLSKNTSGATSPFRLECRVRE